MIPLRAVRKQNGMTLESLAAQTGLTKSYLSKVERQISTPSIATAMKIAHALGIDVSQLFLDHSEAPPVAVDRAVGSPDGERYRLLAGSMVGKSMSPFLVHPTEDFADDTDSVHPGQELIFVHAGTVELDIDGHRIMLGPGDSAYFNASVGHRMRRVGESAAQVLVVTRNEG